MRCTPTTLGLMATLAVLSGCSRSSGIGSHEQLEGGADVAAPAALIGYQVATWAGPKQQIVGCPGMGVEIASQFVILVDPEHFPARRVQPVGGGDLVEGMSNWFEEGQHVSVAVSTFTARGDQTKSLVVVDRCGDVASTVPLSGVLAGLAQSPSAPAPAVVSLAVSSAGDVAALIVVPTLPQGRPDAPEVIVLQLPQGDVISSKSLGTWGASVFREAQYLFFSQGNSLYFLSEGHLVATVPDLSRLTALADDVTGASGHPDSRWAVVWRAHAEGCSVERLDTGTNELDLVRETLPNVVRADIDKTGKHVIIARQSDSADLSLEYVNPDDGEIHQAALTVYGLRPGVQWLRPPVVVVADAARIVTVDMLSGQVTELWSID